MCRGCVVPGAQGSPGRDPEFPGVGLRALVPGTKCARVSPAEGTGPRPKGVNGGPCFTDTPRLSNSLLQRLSVYDASE